MKFFESDAPADGVHPLLMEKLAQLYSQTISTLTPRIMVSGEHGHLNNLAIAAKVRAALLAGIRSAVLWRQLGGRRWQLLFTAAGLPAPRAHCWQAERPARRRREPLQYPSQRLFRQHRARPLSRATLKHGRAHGGLRKIEFPWLRRGNRQHKRWNNTVLGNIRIDGGALTLRAGAVVSSKINKVIIRPLGLEYLGSTLGVR